MSCVKDKVYKSIVYFDVLCVLLFIFYIFTQYVWVLKVLIICAILGIIQIILWINMELFTSVERKL